MTDTASDERATGDLWRDVLNTLGAGPITPAAYVPLLDAIAARWGDRTHFMRFVAAHQADPAGHAEVETEAAWAAVGYRLWSEHRPALERWFRRHVRRHSEGEDDPEAWWFGGWGSHGYIEQRYWRSFLAAIEWTPDERRLIAELKADPGHRPVLIYRLHENLGWIRHLEMLTTIAARTWGSPKRSRVRWTEDELEWLNEWYSEQAPYLTPTGDPKEIDPFALDTVAAEQGLGMGLDGLAYQMTVLIRATVIDFADDLLEASRYPRVRGSLRCIECGRFAGRRALGYGQLYCTGRCKKRAAKRRSRARSKDRATADIDRSAA